MAWVSATEAHKRLDALIEEVGQSHEPVLLIGNGLMPGPRRYAFYFSSHHRFCNLHWFC